MNTLPDNKKASEFPMVSNLVARMRSHSEPEFVSGSIINVMLANAPILARTMGVNERKIYALLAGSLTQKRRGTDSRLCAPIAMDQHSAKYPEMQLPPLVGRGAVMRRRPPDLAPGTAFWGKDGQGLPALCPPIYSAERSVPRSPRPNLRCQRNADS